MAGRRVSKFHLVAAALAPNPNIDIGHKEF
jgi:hypothetical protein